jgi:hypothetical protein
LHSHLSSVPYVTTNARHFESESFGFPSGHPSFPCFQGIPSLVTVVRYKMMAKLYFALVGVMWLLMLSGPARAPGLLSLGFFLFPRAANQMGEVL